MEDLHSLDSAAAQAKCVPSDIPRDAAGQPIAIVKYVQCSDSADTSRLNAYIAIKLEGLCEKLWGMGCGSGRVVHLGLMADQQQPWYHFHNLPPQDILR